MKCVVKEWSINRGAADVPCLQYDNNRPQAVANLGSIGLPDSCRIPLPAYSPDGARAVEHSIGWLKEETQVQLLHWLRQHPGQVPTADVFAGMIRDKFFQRKQEWINKDIKGLPVLWETLIHAKGEKFRGCDGKEHIGTGGDWSSKTHS